MGTTYGVWGNTTEQERRKLNLAKGQLEINRARAQVRQRVALLGEQDLRPFEIARMLGINSRTVHRHLAVIRNNTETNQCQEKEAS